MIVEASPCGLWRALPHPPHTHSTSMCSATVRTNLTTLPHIPAASAKPYQRPASRSTIVVVIAKAPRPLWPHLLKECVWVLGDVSRAFQHAISVSASAAGHEDEAAAGPGFVVFLGVQDTTRLLGCLEELRLSNLALPTTSTTHVAGAQGTEGAGKEEDGDEEMAGGKREGKGFDKELAELRAALLRNVSRAVVDEEEM